MFSIIYDFSNVHFLRKYTTIPVLMDILDRKRISLLDPKKWEDRNDWKIMDKYRELKTKNQYLQHVFHMVMRAFIIGIDYSGVL